MITVEQPAWVLAVSRDVEKCSWDIRGLGPVRWGRGPRKAGHLDQELGYGRDV